jgi:hypothetical protein
MIFFYLSPLSLVKRIHQKRQRFFILLYDTLKASHLMETNTLSDKEKLDVLFKTELLGGRKPLQLLAMNHTVTRATQNEALLRKIAVFGIGKPPV